VLTASKLMVEVVVVDEVRQQNGTELSFLVLARQSTLLLSSAWLLSTQQQQLLLLRQLWSEPDSGQ
jgi:hypothetical protein